MEVENDDEAIQVLVEDNLHRRHLGPIAFARIYGGLAKLATVKGRNDGVDLRDEIARRMGDISGRTLDRYRRILKLPPALIAAVEGGHLNISAGLRILKMPEKVRAKIASEIEAGGQADKVVAQHLRGDAPGESLPCGHATVRCSSP